MAGKLEITEATPSEEAGIRAALGMDSILTGLIQQGETLASDRTGPWYLNDAPLTEYGAALAIPYSWEVGARIRQGNRGEVKVVDPLAAYPWALRLQTQRGDFTKGTTVAVGAGITEWADDMGTSELVAIGEASHIPVLATSNSKRVVNFDGNSSFSLPLDLTLTNMTFFAAVKFDATTGTHGVFANGAGTFYSYFSFINATQVQLRTESNVIGTLNLPSSLATGAWVILELVVNGTQATVYINGIAGSTANIGGGTVKINRLGRASTNYFSGKCAAMLFYNGVMADADRAIVRKALGYFRTTTYYASTSGNDSNDGWSSSTPVATLSKLASMPVYPGDKLLLKRGDEWREKLVISIPWTTGSRVQVDAYGTGNKPKLLGSSQATSWALVTGTEYRTAFTDAPSYDYGSDSGVLRPRNAFWVKNADLAEANVQKLLPGTAGALAVGQFVRNADYVHINIGSDPTAARIELPRNNEEGIRIATGTAPLIDFRNLYVAFFDLNQYTSANGDIAIEDCEIWWGAEDGISPGGTGTVSVRRCKVIRNGNIRTQTFGAGDGISAHFGMTLVVEDCEVRDNEKGGLNNLREVTVTVRRCYITGNNLNAQVLDTLVTGSTHTYEANLIVVQSKDSGNGIRRDGAPNNAIINAINNTIIGANAAGSTGITGANICKNNIIYNFNNGIRTAVDCQYNDVYLCATPYTSATAGAGSISSNPLFANAAGGNYALLPTSPCKGTGTPAGVTTNVDGKPYTNPPNMGAK